MYSGRKVAPVTALTCGSVSENITWCTVGARWPLLHHRPVALLVGALPGVQWVAPVTAPSCGSVSGGSTWCTGGARWPLLHHRPVALLVGALPGVQWAQGGPCYSTDLWLC